MSTQKRPPGRPPGRPPQNSIQERHFRRQKKRRRRKFIFRTTLTLLLLFTICMVAMFLTPWFNIVEITVTDNNIVSFESVAAASEIELDSNIFKLDTSGVRQKLERVPYIKSAKVVRHLPSRVDITIEESRLIAQVLAADAFIGDVDVSGMYIGLDDNGETADIFQSRQEGVLEVIGMNLKEIQLGEKIGVDETTKYEVILVYISTLDKQGMLGEVDSIDVTNIVNVHFTYQGRLKVLCGNSDNLDRKLRMAKEVITGELEPDATGELDVRIDGRAFHRE